MALKFLPHTIMLSKVYQMKEFSNQIKIERKVNNYFSSYNSEQLKSIAKEVWDRDTHTCTHTYTLTYTFTLTHTCIPTSQTKAMLRKTRHALAE